MRAMSKINTEITTCMNNGAKLISHFRSELMGLAMIFIFLFHARSIYLGFMPTGIIGYIIQRGFFGVDVFVFLSAYGLCYSLSKNSLKQFYTNRFKRILPAWLFVLLGVHVVGILFSAKFPNLNFEYPHSIHDCFYWYTGIGFFANECSYEWYIPTLFVFYLLAPLFYACKRWQLIGLIGIVGIALPLCGTIFNVFPYLEIATYRLCVYILGFLFYKSEKENKWNPFILTCLLYIIGVWVLSNFHLGKPAWYVAFACPFCLMLISAILNLNWMKRVNICLSFLGTISLEFYLVHLFRRPQFLISMITPNCYLQVIGAFILSIFAAWMIHFIINLILRLARDL